MKILITGGAGFIGTNLALSFTKEQNQITILDNFSRRGSKINAQYLSRHLSSVNVVKADVRNFNSIKQYVGKNEIIFHLAGQVAVTKSIQNPREDFESNLFGTFNILEAARLSGHKPIVIDSSTNKVYGEIKRKYEVRGKRYIYSSGTNGIAEKEPLDFFSPYGCSKGAADQYVHDYARIYGIPTVVFRQSCIYGIHQFGVEDQGWVAHFIIWALLKKPITIYGTGYQVRDILYINDLIKAYEIAIKNIEEAKGKIFNIGGGIKNSVSLLELIDILEKILKRKIIINFKEKRPGDQDIYISDLSKIKNVLGWEPKTRVSNGVRKLVEWVTANIMTIKELT